MKEDFLTTPALSPGEISPDVIIWLIRLPMRGASMLSDTTVMPECIATRSSMKPDEAREPAATILPKLLPVAFPIASAALQTDSASELQRAAAASPASAPPRLLPTRMWTRPGSISPTTCSNLPRAATIKPWGDSTPPWNFSCASCLWQ